MTLHERIAAVRARIQSAIERRGPGPDVRLVGVSKHRDAQAVRDALAAGLTDFGENYAQELTAKQAAVGREAAWHFIGGLQSNKVKAVVGKVALVHTVDRAKLIDALERQAAALACTQDVLVEVNLGGEDSKSGVAPRDLERLLAHFANARHLRCLGLMAIPPASAPEDARRHFAALRELLARHQHHAPAPSQLVQLSMGMSSDFEIAIEEGATLVRVGTAIFGPRA